MDAVQLPKRRTAYKFWIGDLANKKDQIDENNMRHFLIRGKKALRINVIAIIINAYTSQAYGSLQLDDGSGTIRVKVWNEDVFMIENISVGDLVLLVGKLNLFNNETYIRPEIIKKLDNLDWARLRRLELTKEYGHVEKRIETMQNDINIVHEEVIQDAVLPSNENREKIVTALESFPNGVDIEDFLKKVNLPEKEVELVLDELLKEGEIFQPKPGFIKIV